MKGYVKPEIIEISDMMETIGLMSGQEVTDDSVTVSWQGQDSGNYSEVWIGVKKNDKTKTEYKIQLTLMDSKRTMKVIAIDEIENSGVCHLIEDGAHHVTLVFPTPEGRDKVQWTLKIKFMPGPFTYHPAGFGVDDGSYAIPDGADSRANWRDGIGQAQRGVCDFTGQGNAQTIYGGPFYVQILD